MSMEEILGGIPQAELELIDERTLTPIGNGRPLGVQFLEKEAKDVPVVQYVQDLPALDPDAVAEEAKEERKHKRQRN